MDIEYIATTDIKPYERNAKKHPAEQVEHIANSIKEFGFKQPLVVDADNVLVIGHGRLLAAKKLGMDTIPCVRADDLTPEQIKALRLADNKTNESDWDTGLLDIEFDDITDIDMGLFGFEMKDDESAEIVEDDIPETAETRCKLGDIWQLGEHRLMCGDSTDAESVGKLMDGEKADMVFTDPPYGMKYTRHIPAEEQRFYMLENDDKILDFFPCIKAYSDGFIFICTTWKVLDKWLALFKQYFDLSNMIIWHKSGGGLGDLKTTFAVDYEIILCSSRKKQLLGKRIGSVWSCKRDAGASYEHPTQKPVELSSTAITHTTEMGQSVLDLFGGSGSTLIACEQLNRRCYMMELDPHYCDVILQRWENFTGRKAELVNGATS